MPDDPTPPTTDPPTTDPPATDPPPADLPDDAPDVGDPGEDGRYPAEVVARLRQEAADRRQRARTAEEALEVANGRVSALSDRLLAVEIASATSTILADPADLSTFAEAADLTGEDGLPDRDKIVAAANDLVARKPHLASRRPAGDVDQGARGRPAESFDFAARLRAAAR